MSLTLHTIIASTRPGRVGLQRVVDVRTGSGIFALAAARAGAVDVVALDINPMAVNAATDQFPRQWTWHGVPQSARI